MYIVNAEFYQGRIKERACNKCRRQSKRYNLNSLISPSKICMIVISVYTST